MGTGRETVNESSPWIFNSHNCNPLNDPDLTVTVSGISAPEGENLIHKAESLLQVIGNEVSNRVKVTGAVRLPTRYND